MEANLSAELNNYLAHRLHIQNTVRQIVVPHLLDAILQNPPNVISVSSIGMQIILMSSGPQQICAFLVQGDGRRTIFLYAIQELMRNDNPVFVFQPANVQQDQFFS